MAGGNWKEMFHAAQKGDIELLTYHLRMGVDPNYQHPEYLTTALNEAVQFGHLKAVETLLEHGANAQLSADWGGDTPLSIAKTMKNKEMIRLIEQHLNKKTGSTS